MTLYEMTSAALKLYEMLEADEIDEQTISDTMESIGIGEKLEDYCKVIRQFEADATAIKNEMDKLAAKKKRAENAIERLENAITSYMKASGKQEQPCGIFKIKTGVSKSAKIIDENQIPQAYRIAQPDKIDRAGIRKALMQGENIMGAELQINEFVSIK